MTTIVHEPKVITSSNRKAIKELKVNESLGTLIKQLTKQGTKITFFHD